MICSTQIRLRPVLETASGMLLHMLDVHSSDYEAHHATWDACIQLTSKVIHPQLFELEPDVVLDDFDTSKREF